MGYATVSQQIRVLCVDDNEQLCHVLERLVKAQQDMVCVGCSDSADGLISEIELKQPHVVLMDLTMPGRDPLEVVREAAARFPETRTIVMSGYDDSERVDRAVESGAWGYLCKHGEVARILAAIREVAGGESWFK